MHYMKLYAGPFERMKSGEKNIEFRLNDEKRRKVKIGDYITFKNVDTGEELITECVDLHRADTFFQLFDFLFSNSKMKHNSDISSKDMSKRMRAYYSEENENKYGVLGIEIKLV